MKTDLQFKQDVIAELKQELSIHAAGIGVEVRAARHSAWGTPGVRNVVDNITVGY